MKRSKKIVIVVVAIIVLIAAGIAGIVLNRVNANSDMKQFTIVVQSERDGLDEKLECKSNLGTLGEYVQTLEECQWSGSDYGTYISGWYDCAEDMDNQYWWSVNVDNEMAATGVDGIALVDGQEYEFILVQGW